MDNEANMHPDSARNAMSVYRQEGPMDDFPVLKAFQQYIDAEQNKARKRLVTLCIFFGAMICVVIAVFMVMLHDISRRNQQLNDRLVEYAMRDRDRAPATVIQPIAQAPAPVVDNTAAANALKAMSDTLIALQKQMAERSAPRQEAVPATGAVAPVAQTTPAAPTAPSALSETELERKERLARERIRKERAQLAEERRKFAEERERKHQEEVERHRRRLYPEYYAAQENASAGAQVAQPAAPSQPQQPTAKREISDDDIADILREANLPDDDDDAEEPAERTIAPAQASAPAPAQASAQPPAARQPSVPIEKAGADDKAKDDVGEAIQYFSDDEYEIPVDINGASTKWRVPLN